MAMTRALFSSQYPSMNIANNTGQIGNRRSIQVSCLSSNQEDLLRETFRSQTSYNHPDQFGLQVKEKKVSFNANDHILDGGSVVENINAFGQSFRDYNVESERQKREEEFYKVQHINQTYDYVERMREEYIKLNKIEMSVWDCCELLNEVIDDSDPDLDEPQIEHLLQTAEAIRKDYPNEDWLHLTGLIHDLGKVLLHPSFGGLPQWAVVPLMNQLFTISILRKIQTSITQFIPQKMEYMNKVEDLTKLLCHGDMMIICIWFARKMGVHFLMLLYL